MTVPPNNVRKPVTAASITDATAAGRDMLTAADVAAQRTLLSVYSTAEVDGLLSGLGALTAEDIDTLAEINAIITDANFATVATSGSYNDLTDKPTIPAVAKVYEKVALSPNGAAIAAGAGKGFVPISHAGTITAFSVQCDPNNEPTVIVEVDLNKVNTSDGTVTSVLSAVASITSGNNSGTGTINGTQTVSVGDWLQVDIDQGSDGQDLIGIIEITPS